MFASFFGRRKSRLDIESQFQALVASARTPAFYETDGVPDTMEGRFDLLVAFVWQAITLHQSQDERDVAQALFDRLVDEVEGTLREQGFNDKGFAKRMKKLVAAIYSRFEDYAEAMKSDDPKEALARALAQNIWLSTTPAPGAYNLAEIFLKNLPDRGAKGLANQQSPA